MTSATTTAATTSQPESDSAPNATPLLRTFTTSTPKKTFRASPRSTTLTAQALVIWSSATTTPTVASASTAPRNREDTDQPAIRPATMPAPNSSTIVPTIGLRSSAAGPMRAIGRMRRQKLRYGSVTSVTNSRNTFSQREYGSRNQLSRIRMKITTAYTIASV